MTFDDYLKGKLNNLFDYEITPEEKKAIELGQLKQLLHKRIISNKFTKNNLTDATKELTYKKISDTVDKQEPLFFLFCFGGYKNHWIKEHHPNIGWAEVFNLMYISKLLAPISKLYSPGIIYEFEAEDDAVVAEDNYNQSDVDAYANSFRSLMNHFNDTYMPNNFKFSYKRLGEQYDTKKFFENLQSKVNEKILGFKKLPKEELESKLKRAKFNFKVKGRIDYSNLSEDEMREKYIESLAINAAFLEDDFTKREEYFIGGNHIPLIGAYATDEENVDNWICINSISGRDNAFWTSKGVSIKEGETYKIDILSPSNYSLIKNPISRETSTLFVNIVPNLNSIEIIN